MLHLTHLPHHEPGEKVILHLRRHWFVLAKLIGIFVALAFIPLATRWFLGTTFPGIFDNELWKVLFGLLLSVYYLYWWLLLYRGFLDYYLDLWIVTDRRILNIEQNDLFNRVISEQRLSRIQDVTSKQQGTLSTLLDYGTVTIQTAGQVQYFSFEEIARPHAVAQKINTLVEWNRRHHGSGQNP